MQSPAPNDTGQVRRKRSLGRAVLWEWLGAASRGWPGHGALCPGGTVRASAQGRSSRAKWKEHQLCSVSSLSSPRSCLRGLRGAPLLPELHAPVPWGSYCRVYLAGGVLVKMLHPRVLKLEGTLEPPGGSFRHVGRTPELLL